MLADFHAERIRLARETHQRLGQTLTALKWEAYRCADALEKSRSSDAAQRESMKQILGRIDELGQFSKELVGQLTPNILITLGLDAAIADAVRSFNKRTGAAARFQSAEKRAKLDLVYSAIVLETLNDLLSQLEKLPVADVTLSISKTQQLVAITVNVTKNRQQVKLPTLRRRLDLLQGQLVQIRNRSGLFVSLKLPIFSFNNAKS